MKIKIDDGDLVVYLSVTYTHYPTDDPWTVSPKGIIGANHGHWTRTGGFAGGYDIVFYGTDSSDLILSFASVTSGMHGNPFKKGQSGYGTHESLGGIMMTGGTFEWEVLSM